MQPRVVLYPSLAFALILSASVMSQESESEDGKLDFNSSCRTCHSVDAGDNRLGPNLHDIIGRKAGSEEYGYSPAMKSADLIWDAKTLNRFIENPEAVVPGNNMKPYGGISDPATRARIVEYLSNATGEGA